MLLRVHCKTKIRFPRPQPGCHLPNSPWTGIIDIPPGDGAETDYLFLQCTWYIFIPSHWSGQQQALASHWLEDLRILKPDCKKDQESDLSCLILVSLYLRTTLILHFLKLKVIASNKIGENQKKTFHIHRKLKEPLKICRGPFLRHRSVNKSPAHFMA